MLEFRRDVSAKRIAVFNDTRHSALASLQQGDQHPVSLFAVIVLYRCRLEDSPAFRSLAVAVRQASRRLSVLVWDNTPASDFEEPDARAIGRIEEEHLSIEYHRAPDNPGLAVAYNFGVERAQSQGIQWLLTLDQDSVLPEDYLSVFANEVAMLDSRVALCVPIVVERGVVCSPVRCGLGLPWFFLKWPNPGTTFRKISAINSAAFVRIAAIEGIGGYSKAFAIDYLDHWLCRTLHDHGYLFHVLTAQMEHRLSVNSFATSVSTKRYKSILAAQRQYAVTDASWWPGLILMLTLPLHAFRKLWQGAGLEFVFIAIDEWQLLIRDLLRGRRDSSC